MSNAVTVPHRRRVAPIVVAICWLLAVGLFVALIVRRSQGQDLGQEVPALTTWIVRGSALFAILFWVGLILYGGRLTAAIGVHGLAVIGAVSSLHYTVGAISRIGGQLLQGIMGPYAVFIHGVGDEAIPCFLSAILVVLRPKPGTVGVSQLTVFLLMVVTSGTIGFTALLFISTSVLLHEVLLAVLGVTVGSVVPTPRPTAPAHVSLRIALAIGLANGAVLFAQFAYYRLMYRLQFDEWYVLSVAGVTGVVYGTIGAALGVISGYQLRRSSL
ncbi:MAG: hypothetical protein JNM18_03135 [Planctomycetaceae bacterium]|nr:hypothetical protein [Planctomycetaceae bacterium]